MSDEALAYLCLENNWDRWTDMASHDPVAKDSSVPTKYTDRGKKAKEFCGWNKAGLELYNRFMRQIKHERSQPYGKRIEEEYMVYRKKKLGHRMVRSSSMDAENNNGEVVRITNELFPTEADDDEDGGFEEYDAAPGNDYVDDSDSSDSGNRSSCSDNNVGAVSQKNKVAGETSTGSNASTEIADDVLDGGDDHDDDD